jgi:hypothetical protein
MGAVIAMVTVFIIVAIAVMAFTFFEPGNKALKEEKKLLSLEIDKLKAEIVEKDKELEARRLGLPWYETE